MWSCVVYDEGHSNNNKKTPPWIGQRNTACEHWCFTGKKQVVSFLALPG